jgi:hypothetical protein
MIPASADLYSPQRRTALVLTGTGTAGAYHAGVLRALHEAGVKLDIVAGRGVGVVGALFAAVDGAQRLWDERGFWRAATVRSFYGWTIPVRFAAWSIVAALAVVAIPLALMILGLIVFPIDFVLQMIGVTEGSGLVASYIRAAQTAFAPDGFPTWLPRAVVLVLGLAGAVAIAAAWIDRGSRRKRGGVWWRAVPAPLSRQAVGDHFWRVMWDLVRGAAPLKQPPAGDLARRYTELLAENLGQPGFRELLFTVHDIDAHRELLFTLVADSRRRGLIKRSTSEAADARRAEVFDLSGVARDYLADAVAGALSVPMATEPHILQFAPEAYWRGEAHRLCDRGGSLARILDELADLGVEQAIVVSAAPECPDVHALVPPRLDPRGRLGEYIASSEAAILRDASRLATRAIVRLFIVRPVHNPIGPFDFGGGYDDRSDRRQPLEELLNRGYEDAYRQFIEPVVGASGERVGTPATT